MAHEDLAGREQRIDLARLFMAWKMVTAFILSGERRDAGAARALRDGSTLQVLGLTLACLAHQVTKFLHLSGIHLHLALCVA